MWNPRAHCTCRNKSRFSKKEIVRINRASCLKKIRKKIDREQEAMRKVRASRPDLKEVTAFWKGIWMHSHKHWGVAEWIRSASKILKKCREGLYYKKKFMTRLCRGVLDQMTQCPL